MNAPSQTPSQLLPQIRCMPDDAQSILVGALKQLIRRIHILQQGTPDLQHQRKQWLAAQLATAEALTEVAQANDKETYLRDLVLNMHEAIRRIEPGF